MSNPEHISTIIKRVMKKIPQVKHCRVCNKAFHTEEEYVKHIKEHFEEN